MKLLKASEIVQKIDDGYDRDLREKARDYIGASIVGHSCDALLAFSLRGFPNVEPMARLKRIFGLGHVIEELVVEDLKKRADVRVWEVDGMTGKQFTFTDFGGHVVCHTDGMIQLDDADDEVMILEIKSMNASLHDKFVAKGVKYSHPSYYAQLQFEMGLSGIERSFFIAYNKNTSLYHAEIVEFDPFEYSYLRERVRRVFDGEAAKISADETDWRCRDCFKRGVCWDDAPVPETCQTCAHAVPTGDGWWHCDLQDQPCSEVCKSWTRFLPETKRK